MKTITIMAVLAFAIGYSHVAGARCTQEDQDAGNCPDTGGSCVRIDHCTEQLVVQGGCCALWPEWHDYVGSMAVNAVETIYGPTSTSGRIFEYESDGGRHFLQTFVIGVGGLRCDVVIVTGTNPDGTTHTYVQIGNCAAALVDTSEPR